MVRYHIMKDGALTGTSTATEAEAIRLIREQQAKETHWIRSEFGYIKGEEFTVKYV